MAKPAAKRARVQGGSSPAAAHSPMCGSSFAACPLCGRQVPTRSLQMHLDTVCLYEPADRQKQRGSPSRPTAPSGPSAPSPPPAQALSVALPPTPLLAAPQPGGHPQPPPLQLPALATGPQQLLVPMPTVSPSPPASMRVVRHARLPGQLLLLDFVTEEEEEALLALADSRDPPWRNTRFNGNYMGKAWGVSVDLQARTVQPPGSGGEGTALTGRTRGPLPPVLEALGARMRGTGVPELARFHPNEANAIDYRGGITFLEPHADDRQLSTEVICNLSLAGRAIMTFVKQRGMGPMRESVLLPRRSLQVMAGRGVRYDYTHQIDVGDVLDARRVSISFRHSPLTAPLPPTSQAHTLSRWVVKKPSQTQG